MTLINTGSIIMIYIQQTLRKELTPSPGMVKFGVLGKKGATSGAIKK